MSNIKMTRRYFDNIMKILRDKRHEQKSKSLSFALTYSILPILVLLNLTLNLLPPKFYELIESVTSLLPHQYQELMLNFMNDHQYQKTSMIAYILLIIFIVYTVASNVRLIIEICNDCYAYSQDRSKNKELLISILLFVFIGFGFFSLFIIILLGQTLRTFLEMNNAPYIAELVSNILQMKSVITLIILFMVFYIIYYFAPNVKSTFKTTIVGTLISTIGLFLASYGFEIYLAKSNTYEFLYGAVYSQYLLFLFGMYITCQIIVASMIVNSLIFEKISIKNYHIEHCKDLIDIDQLTINMNDEDIKIR